MWPWKWNKIDKEFTARFGQIESINYGLCCVLKLNPAKQMKFMDFSKRNSNKDRSSLVAAGYTIQKASEQLKSCMELLEYANNNAFVTPQDWDVINATRICLEHVVCVLGGTIKKKK